VVVRSIRTTDRRDKWRERKMAGCQMPITYTISSTADRRQIRVTVVAPAQTASPLDYVDSYKTSNDYRYEGKFTTWKLSFEMCLHQKILPTLKDLCWSVESEERYRESGMRRSGKTSTSPNQQGW
jgi:hypothetical protein